MAKGSSDGVEIRIRAEDENALPLIESIQGGFENVGTSADLAVKKITALTAAIVGMTSASVVTGVTRVANAISAIHKVSKIPIVEQQLKGLYEAAGQAFTEMAPLSRIMRDVGGASSYLSDTLIKKGFGDVLRSQSQAFRDDFSKMLGPGLEGQLKKSADRFSKLREEAAKSTVAKTQKILETQEKELSRIRQAQRESGDDRTADDSAIQAIVAQEEKVFQARKKNQEALQKLATVQNNALDAQIRKQVSSVQGFEARVEQALTGAVKKSEKAITDFANTVQREIPPKVGKAVGQVFGEEGALAQGVENRLSKILDPQRLSDIFADDGDLAQRAQSGLQGFLREKTGERVKEIATGRVLKGDAVSAISDVAAPGLFRIANSDAIFKSARKELVSGVSSAFVAATKVAEDKSFDLGRALGRSFAGSFGDFLAKEAGTSGKGSFFDRGILEAIGDTGRLAIAPLTIGAKGVANAGRGIADRLSGKAPKGRVERFFDLFKDEKPEKDKPDSIDRLYEGDKPVSLDQIIGGILRPTLDDVEKNLLTNVGKTLSQNLLTQRKGAGILEKLFMSKQQNAVGNLIQKGINAGAKTAEGTIATVLRQTVERGLSAALPKGEDGQFIAEVVDFALNSKTFKKIAIAKSKELREGLKFIVNTPTEDLMKSAPDWVANLLGAERYEDGPRQGGETSELVSEIFSGSGRRGGRTSVNAGDKSRQSIVEQFKNPGKPPSSISEKTKDLNKDLLIEIEGRIAALPKEVREKIAKPFQDVAQTASGLISEIGGLALSVGGRLAVGGAIGMPIPTDFGLVQDAVRTISGSEKAGDIPKNLLDLVKKRFAPNEDEGLGLLANRGQMDLLYGGNAGAGAALVAGDAVKALGSAAKGSAQSGKDFAQEFQAAFSKSFTAQNLGPIVGFAKRIAELSINTVKGVIKTANFISEVGKKFREVDDYLNGILSEALSRISTRFVEGFVTGLTEGPRRGFGELIDFIDQGILEISSSLEALPGQIQNSLDLVANPAGYLAGVNEPIEVFQELQGVVGTTAEKINDVSQQIFFFTSAFDSLQSLVANGPYQMLVGQNVELQKQLLETQSSLVATNKILRDGQQITDPTAAIQALDAPVKTAIAKIRRDSLELVGVTSKDLVGVFNIINQSASQANISLSQSADLTSSFAAALGTIGLPLNQASQEINSILTAQIDQNSTLAKTLSLDNERVRQLSQQGKLYDYLTEKLKAFRAGNALAAKTIEGVSSNIQEVFDNITLEAGAPLIEPIVEQLNKFYEALNENKGFLTDYVSGLVQGLLQVGLSISSIVESIGKNLGGVALVIPEYLFKELAAGAKQLAESVDFVLTLFRPFFDLIAKAAEFIIPNLASPFLKVAITLKLVSGVIGGLQRAFKILFQLLPGFGQLLFLITVRTAPLAQEFTNLKAALGGAGRAAAVAGGGLDDAGKKMGLVNRVAQAVTGKIKGLDKGFRELTDGSNSAKAALALLAGRELANIPGAMDAVAKSLGMFGGVIAPLIPQISQFAIVLLGLNAKFPIAGLLQEAAGVITGDFLPAMGRVAEQKGFRLLGEQISLFGEKANKNLKGMDLLSVFSGKVDDAVKNMGQSIAQSAIKMGLWGAAIGVGVVALMELWKRSEDAGDQVRKLSKDLSNTAELIRSTWDETRASVKKPLIDESTIPPTDWIDSIILKMREFEKSPVEALKKVNNLKDGLIFLGIVIVQIFSVAYKVVETAVRSITAVIITLVNTIKFVIDAVVAGWNVVQTIFKNPLDIGAIQGAFDEFGKSISNSFSSLADKNQVVIDDIFEPWRYGFRDLKTKGEESFDELGAAIKEGSLGGSIEEIRASIDGLEKEIENASGGAGSLFAEELSPITTALENLDNGTGSIKNVKDAIASVSQQFPNLAKDLQGISSQLATEFPGDMLTSSKSVEAFGEAIVKLNNEGKPGLEGIASAIDNFRAGKGSISDIKGEIEKYKGTLSSLDDQKQIEALSAPIDALDRSLKSLDGNASNRRMADAIADINKRIEEQQAILKEAEKGGAASEAASKAREYLAALEGERDRLEAFSKDVAVLADPFMQLQKELGTAKDTIEKKTTDIANAQKEATARIRKAAADGIDIETGEKRIVTDAQARILTLQQETQSIEEEIPVRYEAVKKLRAIWDAMTPEEKERSKDLKRQLDTEQAALYEASANGAEKRAELEKAIAEKAISDIDRANKLALEKSEKAETDRLVMLTQMRNQGLITAEDFERRKADAGIESAKTELKAQEDLVKKLEALPKPNDPDEARDREDRIRAEKLKTSQLTLKLLDAERAAYEAQTRVILASLEKQNNRRRAALEESSRSGLITDSEKAEKESELEIQRVRRELSRERDSNKRAELELQLEKAKSSKVDATRRRQQDEFDRAQAQAEAEQLRAQREGGADAEKSYAAALERRLAAARRGVEIAKDANEKVKANLELQKVLNDIEVDRIDRNLKAIENSYKRQNQALQKQTSLLDLAEKSLSKQRELIDSANQLRQSVSDYYDQTLGVISSLEKSDYRRRQLAEVTATIKLQAAIQEVKIAEQTLAIEQQMKRLALEREKIQARIAENEKLGNIKRLEAEEKKAKLRGASPEEIEAIRIERDAAVQDYELSKENTRLVNEQAVAQEQIFEMQRRVQDIQGKGKIEAAAGNLIQNMADPVNRYNAGERYKEYLAQQLGAGNYQQLREGGLQGARDFQEQFFGQGMSRQGLMRGQFFDISQAIADRQNQAFSATLPGAATRPQLPASSAVSMPTIALPQPQLNSIDAIASNVAALRDALGAASGSSPAQGATVTITALNINGSVSDSGKPSPDFSNNFRRELEKVFNEAGRLAIASST